MEIDQELIKLYEEFSTVGSAVASVTSLDERGRSIVGLMPPNMGAVNRDKYIAISRDRFNEYYTTDNCYGIVLYRLKKDWVELAKRHKKALEVLL